MFISADTMAYLLGLGLDGGQLVELVRKLDADAQSIAPVQPVQSDKVEARRAKDRERKRTKRPINTDGFPAEICGIPQESAEISPSDKEVSPTPPSRNYLPLPSEPKGSSGDMTRVREGNSGFDDFWGAYPRREGKKAARAAHAKAIVRLANARAHDPPRFILEAVIRFLPVWQSGQIAPHPTTWLNGDRWDDEIPARGLPVNGRAIPAQPSNNHTAKRDRMLRAIVSLSDRDSRWRPRD